MNTELPTTCGAAVRSSGMVRRHDRALILAIETLALYAHPASYHAIAFMADRPAGWFADDFSHDKNYGRRMPGKEARKTLARIQKLVTPNDKLTDPAAKPKETQ